ncbi:MOSC domain-containing protein [Flavicella sp.]|uniref:MOSC domain-containing protein n=1 Tax=Flavicella sp. TaxID=2957742 RepID=UPI003019E85C
MRMKVIATNLGERKQVNWKGTILDTGIFKKPVDFIVLGKEDVEKDAVIGRRYHGGPENALYTYSTDYYPYWKELYPNLDWCFEMFGENLSIEGMDETSIHVGSSYKVGEEIIEVTKPREPCVKLGMRFNNAKMIKKFWQNHKTGMYFKVLQIGKVKAGDELILIEEKKENKTIAQVYESLK